MAHKIFGTGHRQIQQHICCFASRCTAIAAMSAVAGGAWAAEEPPTLPKIQVRDSAERDEGYRAAETSTATKTDTPLRDVPQSITVISSDLIKDQGMRSMGDVVRYVPGVSMGQGEGHRDAPTLRGNSTTADFFIDGVRDDVQYFRDLYNAERIEVLKGPNAMIFGRGGGGGVINRVTEQADWSTRREATLQGGSDDHKRIAADVGQGVNELLALRLNAMYEDSDSYRDFANLERYAINPTATLNLSDATLMRFGYEYFNDERTVDRGVPSQNGRPVRVDESTFVGNPALSFGDATVSLANFTVLHDFSPNLRLRNHTSFGDYDKFYQNVHANSPVGATGNVTLQAYNSGTERRNLFNQTDVTWKITTGAIEHTLLGGVELGRQETDNTRTPNTTPGTVNIANPTTFAPVTFGSPLQANNRVDLDLAAVYLQDQIALSAQFQVVAGIRFDRFDLDFDDKRPANTDFSRKDELVSPRLGAIYKPVEPVSLYASYSISYLPQSGDQFASLTATTAALEPEEFENIEVGAKWDLRSDLAFTAALYQLDRTNTTAIDLVTSRTVLTGEQRSKGIELGLGGAVMDRWEIMAGYAYQEAEITRTSTAAPAGRTVALVPKHQVSLWNSYRFTPMWRAAVGATHQSDVYASISNAVTLPSYTRVDAALFVTLNPHLQVQLNVENVLDETYWGTAHNDNNITPGSPTAFRLALTARY